MIDISRTIQGRRSKVAGDRFENVITAACRYYREKGIAIVEKTPEPMRPLRPYGNRSSGQYVACFVKQAQPDYKGVLCDGQAIIFEAKHTDKDRIQESVITITQRQNFEDFKDMGAHCFVMVSMGFQAFYRVPWSVFGNMKLQFGRKYMTMGELEPYRLIEQNGIVLILEGVILK